jgi:predicted nucleotidyltransferase component of viral defense system
VNTAMQLKALIRNISKDKKVNAQILLRNYMLERLLERISVSKYKHNFILKGGMLIAAMVGVDTRSTMDMDATIKGVPVSKETIKTMFNEILDVDINDSVTMIIKKIDDIRDEANYAGFRVSLDTNFDEVKQNLKIDITTGDTITPREVEYKFNLMFEERTIQIFAYNLETVLAEKLETIISRGTTNTRMRDFYDVYILTKLQSDNINNKLLEEALNATAIKRGTLAIFKNKSLIITEIETASVMQDLWKRYKKNYDYAEAILWVDVMSAVKRMLNALTH